MAPKINDYAEELKQIQNKVKTLNSHRERLSQQEAVEKSKVDVALKELKRLGIKDAEKKTVDELAKLRTEAQEALDKNLSALNKSIAAGQNLVDEYDTANAE